MASTGWVNVLTGTRLDRAELQSMRLQARRAYDANTHIFEDEADALAALGIVPLADLEPPDHPLHRGNHAVVRLSAA